MKDCVCVVVWHTSRELFETLANVQNLDVYVISHLPESRVPDWMFSLIPKKRIFFENNIGYDWGAYQQFISKGLYKKYNCVFLIHDDIIILDHDVFDICANRIHVKNGCLVIGNGRNNQSRDWPRTHIYCYAHSKWKPPSWNFCHDTVRGSFIGTSSFLLEKIHEFEIVWDRTRIIGIGAGNWSLRATCGKIQDLIGEDAFEFLSDTYLSSPYVKELVRGESICSSKTVSLSWHLRNKLLINICSTLMTSYMNSQSKTIRNFTDKVMQGIFTYL